MKPPTIPFQPVTFFVDFDNYVSYQLNSAKDDINLPQFIEQRVVDEPTMKKMLFKEEGDIDRWMFFNLFLKSSANQGGPKVILVGKDISPFADSDETPRK